MNSKSPSAGPEAARGFSSPSGRTWTVEERPGALRFTSGELVLEYAPWPPSLRDASDEMLVALARLAQPPRLGLASASSASDARGPGLAQLHWLVAALLGEERQPLGLAHTTQPPPERAARQGVVAGATPAGGATARTSDAKLDLASRLAAALAFPPEQRTTVLQTTVTADDRAMLIALAAAIEGGEQPRASDLEVHTLRERARRFREVAQYLGFLVADGDVKQA